MVHDTKDTYKEYTNMLRNGHRNGEDGLQEYRGSPETNPVELKTEILECDPSLLVLYLFFILYTHLTYRTIFHYILFPIPPPPYTHTVRTHNVFPLVNVKILLLSPYPEKLSHGKLVPWVPSTPFLGTPTDLPHTFPGLHPSENHTNS